MNENVLENFKVFCVENNVAPNNISWLLKKSEIDTENQKIRQKVSENDVYVGRCFKKKVKPYHEMFPEMWRYYKVVSSRASTHHSVSCLIFDEVPWYFFDYQHQRQNLAGNYYMGEFDFRGIWTDSILKNKIDTYTEIEEDEYNIALHNYTQELIDMKWCADHWRSGGVLPSDDEWERGNDGN